MKLQLPLKNIRLLKYPHGDIYQLYGEGRGLYNLYESHPGWDIFTFQGDKVLAAHSGTILKADWGETSHGWGVWLIGDEEFKLEGDTCVMMTAYYHMSATAVQNNQKVKAGDTLGWESNTGFVISNAEKFWGNAPPGRGVHLHFSCIPLKKIPIPEKGAYFMNEKYYIQKYPLNGNLGHVDPFKFYEAEVIENANFAIRLAQDIINKVRKYLLLWK